MGVPRALKEINKAGYYITSESRHQRVNESGDKMLRSGQDTSREEECWRDYLTCQAVRIDVRKLLNYLNSRGRIEIPEQGSSAYYHFIINSYLTDLRK